MTPPRPFSSRGFTLIELLTVIAIIGILAAIIIPTVGRVREAARMSQQTSNMRQMGMGLRLYAQENRDRIPHVNNNQVFAGGQMRQFSWMEVVNVYLGRERGELGSAFLHRQNPIWTSPFAEHLGSANPPFSTHFSLNLFVRDDQSGWQWNNRLNAPPTPSRTVMVGETNDTAIRYLDPRMAPVAVRDQATQGLRATLPGNRTMLLWADGHVSAEPIAEVTHAANRAIWQWW